MRGRSAVRNDDLQLDLFGLRLPTLQAVESALPESREALVATPVEESSRTASEGSSESEVAGVRLPTEDAADNIVVLRSPSRELEPPRNSNNYRINEVLSHSLLGEDWIELFNSGTQAVSLANATLTDNFDFPSRYVFPGDTVIYNKP